jgi:hypothetical protein
MYHISSGERSISFFRILLFVPHTGSACILYASLTRDSLSQSRDHIARIVAQQPAAQLQNLAAHFQHHPKSIPKRHHFPHNGLYHDIRTLFYFAPKKPVYHSNELANRLSPLPTTTRTAQQNLRIHTELKRTRTRIEKLHAATSGKPTRGHRLERRSPLH